MSPKRSLRFSDPSQKLTAKPYLIRILNLTIIDFVHAFFVIAQYQPEEET